MIFEENDILRQIYEDLKGTEIQKKVPCFFIVLASKSI